MCGRVHDYFNILLVDTTDTLPVWALSLISIFVILIVAAVLVVLVKLVIEKRRLEMNEAV